LIVTFGARIAGKDGGMIIAIGKVSFKGSEVKKPDRRKKKSTADRPAQFKARALGSKNLGGPQRPE